VPPRAKDETKAKKEHQSETDDKKVLAAGITLVKVEKVGPSSRIRKRQPKKLPLAYCLASFVRLMNLDDELSEEKLVISDYVFPKFEELEDVYFITNYDIYVDHHK